MTKTVHKTLPRGGWGSRGDGWGSRGDGDLGLVGSKGVVGIRGGCLGDGVHGGGV